jgi:putative RNA 2'-phosphotransferase
MKRQNIKELSKFLSLVLRHKPENIGITLSNAGWVDTAELIEKMNAYGKEFNLGTLYDVVENNDKKRFAFNEDRTKIRASQ